jgi:hypothetical protein
MLVQILVSDCKETEEYFEGEKILCRKGAVAKDWMTIVSIIYAHHANKK